MSDLDDQIELARTIRRINEDFPYFCENFITIQTKEGSAPFKLRPYQIRLWKIIESCYKDEIPVRILILKSRQLGFSTFMQIYQFWRTITTPHSGCLTVAQDDATSAELFGKVEFAYDHLPPVLRDPLDESKDSEQKGKKLVFGKPLSSKFHVRTSNSRNLGRGFTFRRVHLSEYAHWEFAEKKLYALLQAIGRRPNTDCVIETTANGHNHFSKLWTRAAEPASLWKQFFVGWSEDPDCRMTPPKHWRMTNAELEIKSKHKLSREQMYWRRVTIDDEFDGNEQLFRQEYPLTPDESFRVSGNTFVAQNDLEKMQETLEEPIAWGFIELVNGQPKLIGNHTAAYLPGPGFENNGIPMDAGRWWIWAKPEPDTPYAIGVDISGGTSKDFSAAHIMNMRTRDIVATFRGKLDPDELAHQVRWMGLTYNTALIVPEKNNEGRTLVLKLVKDLQYPRMFYHISPDRWTGQVTPQWGWITSSKTRMPMLNQLAADIRKRTLRCRCSRTFNDLSTFIRVDSSKQADAAPGTNDDMVFSLGIVNSSEVMMLGSHYVDLSDMIAS